MEELLLTAIECTCGWLGRGEIHVAESYLLDPSPFEGEVDIEKT
jgi:hypothetical protein